MRSKTEKYYIESEYLGHPMLKKMEISKKEFEAQKKYLLAEKDTDNDDEAPMEFDIRKKEYSNSFETVYYFRRGCCETIITKIVCKEGYQFK